MTSEDHEGLFGVQSQGAAGVQCSYALIWRFRRQHDGHRALAGGHLVIPNRCREEAHEARVVVGDLAKKVEGDTELTVDGAEVIEKTIDVRIVLGCLTWLDRENQPLPWRGDLLQRPDDLGAQTRRWGRSRPEGAAHQARSHRSLRPNLLEAVRPGSARHGHRATRPRSPG